MGKAIKVAFRRCEHRRVFDGERREVSVRHQIARRSDVSQHFAQQHCMTISRMNDLSSRYRQPSVDRVDSLCGREWSSEYPCTSAQAQKREQRDPPETDDLAARELLLEP